MWQRYGRGYEIQYPHLARLWIGMFRFDTHHVFEWVIRNLLLQVRRDAAALWVGPRLGRLEPVACASS